MVRYIEVENRKGKILRGFLNLPDGVAHPPVVLNLHGFGGSLSGYKYAHTHLARTLEAEGKAQKLPFPLSMSIGTVVTDPESALSFADYVKIADSRMYEEKVQKRAARK